MISAVDKSSVLFVVLDSCRFDTFAHAALPNFRSVGPLFKASAPSYFTFGSHAAMFVGFTPGLADLERSYLNPKFGKIFKITSAGHPGKGKEAFELRGRSIAHGFARLGYAVIGTGAVGWFDTSTETGILLSSDFDDFFYAGNTHSIARQIQWLKERIARADGRPIFAFLNIGETHVPYYFDGAPWSVDDNPCVPFQKVDRSEECRERQRACCEFVDTRLGEILDGFRDASILVCADHGDCWGEDGIWEHGVAHDKTLTVPLIVRLFGRAVG